MEIRQIGFNTFLGVNRFFIIEECPDRPLFKGRKIIEQFANKKQYISWENAKRTEYFSSWEEFKKRYKITSEIKMLPYKKQLKSE